MSAQFHHLKANLILSLINKELTHCFKRACLETEQENPIQIITRDFKRAVPGESCLNLKQQWQKHNEWGMIGKR